MRTRLTAMLASKTLRALVVIVKKMLIAYLMNRKSTVCILCYSVNLFHWTCSVKRRGFKEDWIMEWEMNYLNHYFTDNSKQSITIGIKKRHQSIHFSDDSVTFSCLVFVG